MGSFSYRIRNRDGRIQRGTCRAGNREEAVRQLIDEGYWVLDLSPRRESSSRFNPVPRMWHRVKRQDLTWFFRQLSSLIEAGVPLMRALVTLQDQATSQPLKVALRKVVRDLKRGESLSEALAAQDAVFPLIAARMVGTGEAGGTLDRVLPRLAGHLEREQELVKQIKIATLYPALLACFAFGVVFFLVGYVVPRLVQAFHYDTAVLPGLTRIILGISTGMEAWFWPIVILIAALGLFIKYWRKTPAGREKTDRLLLALPVIGSILRKLGIMRFANNLGALVQSGLGIIEALETCETLADNTVLAGVIRNVRQGLRRGQSIADAFRMSGAFDPLVIQMVAVGEETGRLDESLLKVAGYYGAETEHLIKSGLSLLEPILIIIMALVVGLIVSGTILPMLDMMTVF
ncbi:MAG: type II secretion system F family protein [Syntrophomonadales bacterium]